MLTGFLFSFSFINENNVFGFSAPTHLGTFCCWNTPQGIAVDNADRVLVTGTLENKIFVLDSQGNKLGNFAVTAPNDIAVDSKGNIYVVTGNGKVEKFGSTSTSPPPPPPPPPEPDDVVTIDSPQPNQIFDTNTPDFFFSVSSQDIPVSRIFARVGDGLQVNSNTITIIDESYSGSGAQGYINFAITSPVPISDGPHTFAVLVVTTSGNLDVGVGFSINTGTLPGDQPIIVEPEIMFDSSQYFAKDPMNLLVIDPSANVNPNVRDFVEVEMYESISGSGGPVQIEETGNDTGIFEFSLQVPDNIPSQGYMRAEYGYYDPVSGSYLAIFDTADLIPSGTLPLGTTATILTDKSSYLLDTDAIITLSEPDLDLNSVVDLVNANQVLVFYKGYQTTLLDSVFDAPEDWLRETSGSSGIFQILIKIPKVLGPYTLNDGDTIEFQYVDNTTEGGSSKTVSATIKIIDFSTTPQPPTSDTTPPKILTQNIIKKITGTGTNVNFIVKVIDNVDGVISPTCNPTSGSFFKVGTNTVQCSATDSSGNTATSTFIVTVQSSSTAVPAWVKSIAGWYCTGAVNENSFIEAVQYLVDNGIIIISTQLDSSSSQSIPQWVKNNACWWSQGLIGEQDFLSGIEYLIKIGVIKI